MAQYIVSARKYRPDNFETLVGQDNIARTLKNSILRGQLAHAYLFCGPRGVGKTTTARIFAKMINCSNPSEDMEPCGECESCISFAEGRSYCIHELDAASNNGVEDIKALIDQVRIPPQVGKYGVYIIDEVHMLSQQAFNAFLKTLEEPPAHAIFILATTEKHKILPTILSRCQTYDFNRISVPDIVSNLRMIATKEDVKIDDESLHIIAQKADGAMRDALTIFDQTVAFCGSEVKYDDVLKNLNVLGYEHSFALVDAFLRGDYSAAMLKFDEVLSKGFNALHFVAALSSHLRDLIVSKSAGMDSLLELPDSLKERYREQASRCTARFLFEALGITTQCEAGYKASINPRLHIEFALMKLSVLAGGLPKEEIPVPVAKPEPKPQPSEEVIDIMMDDDEPEAKPAPAKPVEKPQPEPAEEPQRRRRTVSTGLSLKDIGTEKKDDKKTVIKEEDKLPSDEAIREKWQKLATLYPERPRLMSALSSGELDIEEKDGVMKILFKVANSSQRDWIQSKLLFDLESKLTNLLGSTKIKLEIGLLPQQEVEKTAYMPQEQAKEMIKENPVLGSLLSDMDATIK